MRPTRTSSTLRRLFLETSGIYAPFTPATRRVIGAALCQLTTRRPPWAHQLRFASNDPKGTAKGEDPYKVLDVPRNASQADIQKAYYSMAKKIHPDASKEDRAKFQNVLEAYEKIKTPEARKTHDAEVERERAATPPRAQPSPKPEKSQPSSGGSAKFVSRASKRYQRAKQEAEAQKERDLAAQSLAYQRQKDLAAQKQREMLERYDRERRDRKAALRDSDKLKEPGQTGAARGNTTSPANKARTEPKSKLRSESPNDAAVELGAGGKMKSSPTAESSRVAICSVGVGASIEHVIEALALSAIGSLALIQISLGGIAKLDFFTADAARKLQQVVREGKFIVNKKKVHNMTLHASALPIPQDTTASRVLVVTDPCADKMPDMDSQTLKFILRQEGHDCRWVQVGPLRSRTRVEFHFSSFREAEKAGQILQSLYPGIQIRYGIDPATGSKEPGASFLKWITTGEDLPETVPYRLLRGSFFSIVCACCCGLVNEYFK